MRLQRGQYSGSTYYWTVACETPFARVMWIKKWLEEPPRDTSMNANV